MHSYRIHHFDSGHVRRECRLSGQWSDDRKNFVGRYRLTDDVATLFCSLGNLQKEWIQKNRLKKLQMKSIEISNRVSDILKKKK